MGLKVGCGDIRHFLQYSLFRIEPGPFDALSVRPTCWIDEIGLAVNCVMLESQRIEASISRPLVPVNVGPPGAFSLDDRNERRLISPVDLEVPQVTALV